ncbi:hypothetical protein [Bacillus thuringiensis]|uniref:hypothetical protein n=1 Tax=Bacillus thuringiensis TaxID=1428 RepID=UPI0021D688CA|nr:hypothetical protein [Bacillus thuringiensis]MCU7667610.1 hypothetical protein [Bacillus thuringiensis]
MLKVDENLAKELGMTQLKIENWEDEDYQSVVGVIKEEQEYSVEITRDGKYEYIILRVFTIHGDSKTLAENIIKAILEKKPNALIFLSLNREPRIEGVYGDVEYQSILSYLNKRKQEFVISYGMVEWDIRDERSRRRLHSGELFVFLNGNHIQIHEDNGEVHTFEILKS